MSEITKYLQSNTELSKGTSDEFEIFGDALYIAGTYYPPVTLRHGDYFNPSEHSDGCVILNTVQIIDMNGDVIKEVEITDEIKEEVYHSFNF